MEIMAQKVTPTETYYLPMGETALLQSMKRVNSRATSPLNSMQSITTVVEGTRIWYNQREDGFEAGTSLLGLAFAMLFVLLYCLCQFLLLVVLRVCKKRIDQRKDDPYFLICVLTMTFKLHNYNGTNEKILSIFRSQQPVSLAIG